MVPMYPHAVFTHHALANVVWPALYLLGRMVSLWVIAFGLFVEFFFVWRMTGLGWRRAAWADAAMNLASGVVGLILIPAAGLVVVLPFPSTFGPASWVATFCVAVLTNAWVEGLVLRKGFGRSVGRRGVWLLCLANALSVGAAFGSFRLYPIPQ